MNTTGCPSGWATDEVLYYKNVPLACDMSTSAWAVISILVILGKLITAAGQTHLWFARQRSFRERGLKSKRRVIPLFPLLAWGMFVTYVIMFATAAYNVANADNGFTAFFFGIAWIFYGLMSIFFLLKFVHLGSKILPPKAQNFTQMHSERLRKLDGKGRVSLVLQMMALTGQTIVNCIFGPLFPRNMLIIQLAAGFHSWFTFQHGLSMLFHFERVKSAIKEVRKTNVSSSKDLQSVLKKLSEQEFIVGVLSAFGFVAYLVIAVGAVPPRYFIWTLVFWIEGANFLGLLYSNYSAKWQAEKARAEKRTAMGLTPEASSRTRQAAKYKQQVDDPTKDSGVDNFNPISTPFVTNTTYALSKEREAGTQTILAVQVTNGSSSHSSHRAASVVPSKSESDLVAE